MKKIKDIDSNEVWKFIRKLVWYKSTGRSDLLETTQEFWRILVTPEVDNIITVANYNLQRKPEEEITEEYVIINIALAIVLTLSIKQQVRNKEGETLLELMDNPDNILQYYEISDPKFKDKVQLIAHEITSETISWIHCQRYIIETELSNVNYSSLEEFLTELIEVKKTKEETEKKKLLDNVLEGFNISLNLVARRFRMKNESEESDPSRFVSNVLKNLTTGAIAKRSIDEIMEAGGLDPFNGSKEKEIYREIYEKESEVSFEYLKTLLGPGLIWWVKENFSNHPEVKLEDIKETFDDYDG